MRTIAGVCHYALSPPIRAGAPEPGATQTSAPCRQRNGQVNQARLRPDAAPMFRGHADYAQRTPVRRGPRAAHHQDALPYGSAGTRLAAGLGSQWPAPDQRRAIGSAGERLVHTEEVTGSIPVSPTQLTGQLRSCNWPFLMPVQHWSTATV